MRISFDNIDTWPAEVRTLFDRNQAMMARHDAEQRRLDKDRYTPATNQFARDFARVRSEIELALAPHSILGMHCTRLLPQEAENIRFYGMEPLSREFAMSRVNDRLEAGDIGQEEYDEIVDTMPAGDSNRDKMIWFSFSDHPLSMQSDVGELLSCWGGEGINKNLSINGKAYNTLKTLGAPFIIMAEMAFADLTTYPDLFPAFYDRFKFHDGIQESRYGFEGYVESRVPASRILSVLGKEDVEFQRLTKSDTW